VTPRLARWAPWLLAAAVAAAYANSMGGVFVFDDERWILRDVARTSPAQWRTLVAETSRPVLRLSLAANAWLAGTDPRAYHWVNGWIHLGAVLALYGVARRTALRLEGRARAWAVPGAFAVALLWAVHPLQTQAVTYVVQRGESGMGAAFLAALYAALRASEAAGRPRAAWCAAAFAAAALAMGTKEVAAVLPVVFVLYDRTFLAGSVAEALRARGVVHAALWAGTWGVLLGGLGAGTVFAGDFARPDLPAPGALEYLGSQPGVILHYLRLVVWPVPLVFDYGWPVADDPLRWGPAFAVVAGAAVASFAAWWRGSPAGFLGAAFFVLLAPTSSVVPIADLAVEHRMYLPLAPVLAALVWGAGRALAAAGRLEPRVALGVLAVAAAALGARTIDRNADYASAVSLWRGAAAARPENARAHYNLGTALRAAGQDAAAVAALERAVALAPTSPAWNNLGNALQGLGRLDEAAAAHRRAIDLDPSNLAAYYNLARDYQLLGRPREAAVGYRFVLREAHPRRDAERRALAAAHLAEVEASLAGVR